MRSSAMSLLRSSLVVGAAASFSRVLGFVRDLLIAQTLGAGAVADAFLAAFRLPNLIRRVLSEGGLNPALVPVLARLPADEAASFAGEALVALSLFLVVLIAFVEVTAGFAVLLLAPGLADDPQTLALAALCTRLGFPLVAGVALTSLVAAVLNHSRRFVATALAPLLVNAILVVALLRLDDTDWPAARQAAFLAGLSSLAGFAQLALVAVALRGRDAPIRLSWPRFDARLRKLLAAVALTVAASSALPLFVIVGTQAASFTPSAVSWLYFADRLMQLPFGIVASVVGVVLLPELARHHAAGRDAALVSAQNRALEIACLVAAPAAIGLGLCAETIVAVLFERGAFGADDTLGTAARPAGAGLGLPFAVAGKVLAQTLVRPRRLCAQIRASRRGSSPPRRSGAPACRAQRRPVAVGLAVAAGCIAYAAGLAGAPLRRRPVAADAAPARRARPGRGGGAPPWRRRLLRPAALWRRRRPSPALLALLRRRRRASMAARPSPASAPSAARISACLAEKPLTRLALRPVAACIRRAATVSFRGIHGDVSPAGLFRRPADREPASRQLSRRHQALRRHAGDARLHLLRRRHARDHRCRRTRRSSRTRSARSRPPSSPPASTRSAYRLQPEPGVRARGARLGLQLRRPHGLARTA